MCVLIQDIFLMESVTIVRKYGCLVGGNNFKD